MPAIVSKYRRILIFLWFTALLLTGLSWWHVARLISESHTREISNAQRDLSNLTRVSQEHANRTFRAVDQVIRFIQSRYLEIGNKIDLTELTRKGVIDAELFPQVGIIDANGMYILANLPIPTPMDLSDREHFKVHVAADTGELFVSKPVLGRASGKWSIQLTRRITRANGEFAGVVVVSIAVDYFTRFYGELQLGSRGMAALYGLDGVARVRRVGDNDEFGTIPSDSYALAAINRGETMGSFTNRSLVDGIERLYSYRKIPGYNLFVIDAQDIKYVLASHQRSKEALLLQASMVSLLIVALAAALTRYLIQLRRAMYNRQRAQKQIEERNEQLNAIFELSPDAFVSFDSEKRVTYINPAFRSMTGQGTDVLHGCNELEISEWLIERCAPNVAFSGIAALHAKVTQGTLDHREVFELEKPVKRVLEVGLRVSSSRAVSQILYLRDITRENEVEHLKSEFLATAAHELRTPMASILGYSEVLLHAEFDEPTRHEMLDTIYSQSTLMANILNELLDLARIEARRSKDFRYTLVHMQELLTEVIKGLPLPAQRTAPELDLPAQPLYLMADSGKLRQALINVLSNAYKYSPKGGTVLIRAWVNEQSDQTCMVCIEITDHGIGLTPEQLQRVFERFYRADTSGKVLGTGLGMSIVKEIIDLHHGEIHLESTPGKGTCVQICLPAYTTLRNDNSVNVPLESIQDTRPGDFS